MNLNEQIAKFPEDTLKKATLCFLVREEEILLAMKKRGFGVGRWNGVGGKVEAGESVEEAMIRETKEEIGVTPKEYYKVAVLDFYFVEKPEWNQRVFCYFAGCWEGVPSETEEMSPRWYSKNELPLKEMWPDDVFWLPLVINRKKISAKFLFGKGDVVLEHIVSESV